MRGIKKALSRMGLTGSFALALSAMGSTARADSSARHVVLPSSVRAARTPSKPPHVTPPIGISATTGTLKYLKSHHRDPVMVFEIKLSRAPGKSEVTCSFATAGSTTLADSEFQNVSGEAIFHGTATRYKVYVPVIAPLGTDPANYISLQLSNPTDGIITNGQGIAVLVAKGHLRK